VKNSIPFLGFLLSFICRLEREMETTKKKIKGPTLLQRWIGLLLGFLAWVGGIHCLETDERGAVRISGRKLLKHLLKLFLWVLWISLVCRLLVSYCAWLLNATVAEKTTAFLVKSVVFLYVRVFWPRVFPEILPGFHVFFCPQCYQKQTFRFQPVSLQLGFFVTYLCRHCFCLVDAWGGQIFYPQKVSLKTVAPAVVKMIPVILLVLAAGVVFFKYLWDLF
jgi:hypothetical protein